MASNIEVEASRFARAVEEIEKLIRDGGRTGPGYPLAAMLGSAQGRLDSLRAEEEHTAVEKKEKEQKDRSAIAAMVEREAKLNEEEKKKYAEFLARDYFTKSDFGDLSRFYTDGGAYDRLSNEGKAEMDERVKEGVRRGEFSRDELPNDIEGKAYGVGKGQEKSPAAKKLGNKVSDLSGDDRANAISNAASKVERREPAIETSASKENSKGELPAGLVGLAGLFPVQETSGVVVPQTGIKSGPRELGG